MRTIMLLNAKGGCGKSTLATNLASHYVTAGKSVILADFDPQGSSIEWLAARPADRPEIVGVRAWKDPVRAQSRPDYLIIDAPARVAGRELGHLIRRAETIIIPVMPSPIDIRAAAHFIRDLLLMGKIVRKEVKLAVVANRVRENTLIYYELEQFLKSLHIPFVATLREAQNYIRAAERGLGIFELAPSLAEQDIEQWEPILEWLRSKRSIPVAS